MATRRDPFLAAMAVDPSQVAQIDYNYRDVRHRIEDLRKKTD